MYHIRFHLMESNLYHSKNSQKYQNKSVHLIFNYNSQSRKYNQNVSHTQTGFHSIQNKKSQHTKNTLREHPTFRNQFDLSNENKRM